MSPAVPADVRRLVAERADRACEYCGIPESLTYFGCQIDHIVSVKHGGETTPENLCYACVFCNRFKGTDIGSVAAESGVFVRFFNPRRDRTAPLSQANFNSALFGRPGVSLGTAANVVCEPFCSRNDPFGPVSWGRERR